MLLGSLLAMYASKRTESGWSWAESRGRIESSLGKKEMGWSKELAKMVPEGKMGEKMLGSMVGGGR